MYIKVDIYRGSYFDRLY